METILSQYKETLKALREIENLPPLDNLEKLSEKDVFFLQSNDFSFFVENQKYLTCLILAVLDDADCHEFTKNDILKGFKKHLPDYDEEFINDCLAINPFFCTTKSETYIYDKKLCEDFDKLYVALSHNPYIKGETNKVLMKRYNVSKESVNAFKKCLKDFHIFNLAYLESIGIYSHYMTRYTTIITDNN